MRIIRHLILLSLVCQFSINLFSQNNDALFAGYRKKDSSYIQPIYRSSPNNSMLQNYSTKGSFNPYTGIPDWTEAYLKVSNVYRNDLPSFYKEKYQDLFSNLMRKDTVNYFKLVNSFERSYKLFFTGLFKYNENDIEGAYKIFDELNKIKKKDSFLGSESSFWLNATSKYKDATAEFINLYSGIEKDVEEHNYKSVLNKIDNLKESLNFYDRYLLKYNFEVEQYNYLNAITALDSLKKYSPDADKKDLVVGNYQKLVELLYFKQNYLKAIENKTYYYPLDSLYNNLIYYNKNWKLPLDDLQNASFAIDKRKCTDTDSILSRHLIDTLKISTAKIDEVLDFGRYVRKQWGDTLLIVSLSFKDSSAYGFYKKLLSDNFTDTHSITKSLAYVFTSSVGEEHMIYRNVVAGLVLDNANSIYQLYMYCLAERGKLKNLTSFFSGK